MNDMNRWESLFGGEADLPAGDPDLVPEPPPESYPLVLAVGTGSYPGDPVSQAETGLQGAVINGVFLVPFASVENAVDCLRVLIRDLRRIKVINGES